MARKNVFFKIQTSRTGKMYAEAVKDFSVSKGEKFAVLDPRQFLSPEQVGELEENGKITLSTPSGKEYTLYASLVSEVAKFEE